MGCGWVQASMQVDSVCAGTELLPDPWVPTPGSHLPGRG
jgi:hypothetical protein